jgi:hypothetical protein
LKFSWKFITIPWAAQNANILRLAVTLARLKTDPSPRNAARFVKRLIFGPAFHFQIGNDVRFAAAPASSPHSLRT